MKSIVKSFSTAVEIFAPAVLVAVVMILYVMRPANGTGWESPAKSKHVDRAVFSLLDAGPAINHQLRSQKN